MKDPELQNLNGEDLASILRRQERLDSKRVVNIGVQLCAQLERVHRRSNVHGKIMPSNVIISTDSKGNDLIELADSRTAGSDVSSRAPYMSPEECLGEGTDTRADIYSLGALLYEALSGRTPFEGSSPREITLKQLEHSAPPLEGKSVPASVQTIIFKALQKKVEARYQKISDMKTDLQTCLSSGVRHRLLKVQRKTWILNMVIIFCVVAISLILWTHLLARRHVNKIERTRTSIHFNVPVNVPVNAPVNVPIA